MSASRKGKDYIHQPRRDRMYEPHVQDPYQARGKWREPTVCAECGAIFTKGRWQWGEAPDGAHRQRCPACSRIHDKVPAGILTLSGDFFEQHKDEIMRLVHNAQDKEKAEHPLERIMGIESQGANTIVSYSSVHLAKGTGQALHDAYQGEFNFEYAERDSVLHASWKR